MATLPHLGIQKFHKKKHTPAWPRPKNKKSSATDEIERLQSQYDSIDASEIKFFTDFPLSENTKKGLKENGYKIPTEIQRESIGVTLQGKDILGAAETGSGKTLAFLVPVLEVLNSKQWTRMDGMGALIITPTRELAYQIFETLKKVGFYHDFSAGLIIGGKDLHFERDRMDQCNIVICTPGRILHHMDVNPLFECSNLQILVLDEADRCLDMGFEKTMNSIIENLPAQRQTVLFSATQTKSVKDLARLSLKSPVYVSVHENKKHSTPDALEQSYVLCELEHKINLLWSFIKNHRRQKILIFLSSCKQTKYIYQLFCRLRPGTPLLALYGTLHQLRRMKIYNEFCSKQNVVMFATDIAARGLDFPEVNWVVQLDCPEDANTYIHRAGRTARYSKGGESLLVLLPSEEAGMTKELETKRIPITKIEVNQTKLMSPVRKMEALLARDPELKADAQRAFVAYIKSVFLMKNKEIFKVEALDFEKFAASLGLVVTPRIRFLKDKMKARNDGGDVKKFQAEPDVTRKAGIPRKTEVDDNDDGGQNSDTLLPTEEDTKQFDFLDSNEEDDFLTIKRKDHDLPDGLLPIEDIPTETSKKKKKAVLTKAAVAKKILKKKIVANKKTIFTDEGDVIEHQGKEKFSDEARAYENENVAGIDIAKAKEILRAEDKFDKKLFRERVKQKHKEKKRKLKEAKQQEEQGDGEEGGMEVRLGSGSDSEDGSEPDTSWIPDPDKFYGKEDRGEDETLSDNNKSDSEGETEPQAHRKRKKLAKMPVSKKKKEADTEGVFNTGLTLREDEEIALRVLQQGR